MIIIKYNINSLRERKKERKKERKRKREREREKERPIREWISAILFSSFSTPSV